MSQHINHRQAGGFTLVELMIAMVLGLIVIGAVLALSLSMIRANSDTISATRLTQELRATSASIASELNRAGSSGNPFDVTASNALGAVTVANSAKCISYSYNHGGTIVNRTISLAGDAIYLGTTACGAGGTKLSSDQVQVTKLLFAKDVAGPFVDGPLVGRTIAVVIEGKIPPKPGKPDVIRKYSQTVFAPGLGT